MRPPQAGPSFPVVVTALAFLGGCSEPNTPPTSARSAVALHPAGWVEPQSPEFHGRELAANRYDFSECIECHGTGTSGGIAGLSCAVCHTSPDGPEACNTCHGNFDANPSDLLASAPPRGLDDETDPRGRPVGAHRRHLEAASDRAPLDRCAECHTVPDALDSPGHVDDDLRAEVPLRGAVATLPTAGGVNEPAGLWDPDAATCSNTYCHGRWTLLASMSTRPWMYATDRIEGNDARPTWDDPESGQCGTCHDLPPIGHESAQPHECVDCHETVIDEDGVIIDSSKHVDGRVDVFDESYPMF